MRGGADARKEAELRRTPRKGPERVVVSRCEASLLSFVLSETFKAILNLLGVSGELKRACNGVI